LYIIKLILASAGDIVNELPLASTVPQHLKELKNAGLESVEGNAICCVTKVLKI
jgi:hypothetical protein